MDTLYGIPWRKGSKPGISAELSRAGTASTAGPTVDGSRGKLDNSNTGLSTQSTEHPNKIPQKMKHPICFAYIQMICEQEENLQMKLTATH